MAPRGARIDPEPPRAGFALPWDDADAPDPVAALQAARDELGDTFVVDSGRDRLLFVFSPGAVRELYAVPERTASKGLADYRMLLRKLPKELFADRRTFAHDLFGAQDVEGYLGHLDTAIARQIDELGDAGTFDAFGLARRLGHRLAIGCWMGDGAATPPMLDALIADFEVLDGAEAFVHPDRAARAGSDRVEERAALARVAAAVAHLLRSDVPTDGFLAEIDRRWAGTGGTERVEGVTGDVVLLHVATMTNLFAALGWTLALVLLHPEVRARVELGDDALLERCVLEATRIGQRSIMMRTVLEPWTLVDGTVTYQLDPGLIVATMVPLTNTTAAPGLDTFDPDRWDGRRLRDDATLPAPELVVTFGHGPHRCPARRFSLSAIGRAVRSLVEAYDLTSEFDTVVPLPGQIGGVARAGAPCPVRYARRSLR